MLVDDYSYFDVYITLLLEKIFFVKIDLGLP